MSDKDRIVLEQTDDGERWRMVEPAVDAEGHAARSGRDVVPDAEGHAIRARGFSLEPDGQDDDGTPLFRIAGDDAEGHGFMRSDRRLKCDIRPI